MSSCHFGCGSLVPAGARLFEPVQRSLPGRRGRQIRQARNDQDDYAHRMKTNAVAMVFLAALVAGGIWIVDVMAQQRKIRIAHSADGGTARQSRHPRPEDSPVSRLPT